MKLIYVIIFCLFFSKIFAQFEISTGYAVNKRLADGIALNMGYEFKIKDNLYTKSQIGYKRLYHFNDFVGTKINVSIFEFHQTISCEIIKRKKYILKPNFGISYRFFNWKAEMIPPIDNLPIRVYRIGFSNNKYLKLENSSTKYKGNYKGSNVGFCIQIQNQIKLNHKTWLLITPFLESDYDRIQNTGGCYIGFLIKDLL